MRTGNGSKRRESPAANFRRAGGYGPAPWLPNRLIGARVAGLAPREGRLRDAPWAARAQTGVALDEPRPGHVVLEQWERPDPDSREGPVARRSSVGVTLSLPRTVAHGRRRSWGQPREQGLHGKMPAAFN